MARGRGEIRQDYDKAVRGLDAAQQRAFVLKRTDRGAARGVLADAKAATRAQVGRLRREARG